MRETRKKNNAEIWQGLLVPGGKGCQFRAARPSQILFLCKILET